MISDTRAGAGNFTTDRNGAKNPKAKLTNEQALEIFYSLESAEVLSDRFKINTATVDSIRSGQSWISVTGGRAVLQKLRAERKAQGIKRTRKTKNKKDDTPT